MSPAAWGCMFHKQTSHAKNESQFTYYYLNQKMD